MGNMWISIVFAVCALAYPLTSAATDKVVCYFGSWSTYRPGNGQFNVENINPYLCTHLIYAFVGINGDGSIRILDTWNDIDLGAISRFNALKNQNANLKTLVAIGGWNEGSETFSQVASSPTLRSEFVQNALTFIQTHGFDGFDLDWEYPGQRGGAATDKENFVSLLAEFRSVFNEYDYLLTAAVAATGTSVDISYDVPALSQYLDFINVMAYDMHGSWDGVTGQNAPLYASSIDTTAAQQLLNVDASIQGWISRGADPAKLILGVGTYGRSFTLANSANNYLGAATTGAGTAGQFTQEAGFLGYNEICLLINGGGWTVIWDNEQMVPYAYSGNQWVGYDDVQSIGLKVGYAINMNLGGIMVWSIETDDFRGSCGTVNPLLNQINAALQLGGSGSGSSFSSTTTTTTPASPIGAVCTQTGYMRDPNDCSTFYYCSPIGISFIQYEFQCPAPLVFDSTLNVCNYASAVQC